MSLPEPMLTYFTLKHQWNLNTNTQPSASRQYIWKYHQNANHSWSAFRLLDYCWLVTPYGITWSGRHFSGNSLLPNDTKPLPEIGLTYHFRCPVASENNSLIVWQPSWPASLSLAGLTLWPNWLERWLATLCMLSTQVRILVGLSVPGHDIVGSSAGPGTAQRIDSALRARLWVCYQPRTEYQWGCRCQDVTTD